MTDKISRRGVYKDLNVSPYEFRTPYGDLFKFPSQKKLDIYARDIPYEIHRITKAVDRLDLKEEIPPEILALLFRATYKAFYRKIMR